MILHVQAQQQNWRLQASTSNHVEMSTDFSCYKDGGNTAMIQLVPTPCTNSMAVTVDFRTLRSEHDREICKKDKFTTVDCSFALNCTFGRILDVQKVYYVCSRTQPIDTGDSICVQLRSLYW